VVIHLANLKEVSRKRKLKNAAAKKAKANADAAAAADATTAAAATSTATAASIEAASRAAAATSCAAAAATAPAAPAGSGSAAASNRVVTRQSYAAAVTNGPAVTVNVYAETTSVVAASVSSPSPAATKLSVAMELSKKMKLSATVASPAAMADLTGDAFLPPSAQDLHTTTLKSPKKRDNLAAAVGHGATDASVPASKSRYPSRRNAGRITNNVVGASSHPLAEDDADPIVPANLASLAAKKSL